MNAHYKTIELDTVCTLLAACALSDAAKEQAQALRPFLREAELKGRLAETTGAHRVLEALGTPPLSPMQSLRQTLQTAGAEGLLTPAELAGIATFLAGCGRMHGYLRKAELIDATVASVGGEITTNPALREEIERCIRGDTVDDNASAALRSLRHRIETLQDEAKSKLESMLRSKKAYFSDSFVVTRGDRFALPVKKQYKSQVPGTVLDVSGTGGTVFIEPTQVRKLTDEIADAKIAEENEVRHILYTLTGMVQENAAAIRHSIGAMEMLDFWFAKAKLSVQMRASEPVITTNRRIHIHAGRHPLLPPERCVPLDFSMGDECRGIIITGPNTGGKTVALKTIGLLSIMAQCGLHVPADSGSVFSMHANVLCDIGDGQSITENLSTFSAHMTNIIAILREVTDESLVLLDELGSGTDPAEGMGLAIAILEELRLCGCLFVATSHYPQVKDYARQADAVTNACMAFDRESLSPLYTLQMGEAGESCALYIAQRLGLDAHLVERAHAAAYDTMPDGTMSTTQAKRGGRRIQAHQPIDRTPQRKDRFQQGDSVRVFPEGDIGIVYQPAGDDGMLLVQVKGKKVSVNHKRLKLLVSAEEMYPDGYDFSIVFDTVENRKARRKLDKGNPNGVIVYETDS